MKERRKYQRYAVKKGVNTPDQFEVLVAGVTVRLVNFSLGGLYVLSKVPFSPGKIDVSVCFKDRGKIELVGKVVDARQKGEMWGIEIDLTKAYNLDVLETV